MYKNFQQANEYSASDIAEAYFPPTITGKTLNQQFIDDINTIVRATNYITNPTERQQLLEFSLAELVANYTTYKIAHLLETDLQKALNHAFNNG